MTALALVAGSLPGRAHADTLPSGARVTAGNATIGSPTNGNLTVTQSSNRAIVNWNTFSIGAGNSVNFVQPGTGSAVLNRVTGDTTSVLAGRLTGNGQVFLVNPNGIAITPTGTVDVGGGFVASSLNIRNADFMSGNLSFFGTGGAVSNAGSITSGTGGFAVLLGGSVSNSGIITVPMGRVGLGAGTRATLDLTGDGFLQIASPNASGGGGTAKVSGAQVREAVRNVVNHGGSATPVSAGPGRIVFGTGTPRSRAASRVAVANAGAVENSGAIRASGGHVALSGRTVTVDKGSISTASATAKGGSIVITASETIALLSAHLDASGTTGGGSIKIGGDFQGKGTLPHAQGVTVDAGSVLRADATRIGNGGQIVVWSDGATTAQGLFSARAGALGGNGGQIETSGHTVNFNGIRVDAKAVGGVPGTWLIDPEDLIVDAAAASSIAASLGGGTSVTLQTTATTASGPGTHVNGTGNIIINADLAWSSGAMLTLDAYRGIIFNANVTANGGGKVTMLYNNGAGLTGVETDNLLRFVPGKSLSFDAAGGQTGRLAINRQPYKLIFDRAQLEAINRELTVQAGASAKYGLDPGDKVIGGNYALGNNIDLTGKTYNASVISFGVTGNNPPPFAGIFEGLGHTIANMNITVPRQLRSGQIAPNSYGVGFIGFLTGTVRDIGIVSGSVGLAAGTNNSTYDSQFVGGLVGFASGESVITTSYSAVSVTGAVSVGGLVGDTVGRVSYSYATGAVSGLNYIGGLVGSQGDGNFNTISPTTSITNSYATGTVSSLSSLGRDVRGNLVTDWGSTSGGLVGEWFVGTISNSYATGDVLNSAGSSGGLVGRSGIVTYSSVYASGRVDTTNRLPRGFMGGLIGSQNGTSGTNTFANGAFYNRSANPTLNAVGSFQISTDSSAWTPANSNGTATGLTSAQMNGGNLNIFFAGFSSDVWSATAGSTPKLTAWNPPPAPPATPVTYTTADVVATYGTMAALGNITLSGVAAADAGNVVGNITLYDGNGKVVTLSPTLAAGTYFERVTSLAGSAASRYSLATIGNIIGRLVINPLALNLTGSRIYNGTSSVQGNSLIVSNRVGNDVVTLSGTGTLSSANAGSWGITSFGNITVSNPNYTLTGATSDYTINPLAVTLTGTKTYDSSVGISGASLVVVNSIGNDVVTVSGTGQTALAGANVGSRNFLSFAGLSLSNPNYTLSGASGSVNVVPRAVTLSGSRFYDGTNSVQGSSLIVSNGVGNDVVTLSGTGTLSSANAGSWSITSFGNITVSNPNYTLTGATSAYTIAPRGVRISGSKVYDGSTSVLASQMTVESVLQGDTVTLTGNGTVRLPGVGQQTFRTSSFSLSNPNYVIGSIAALNITPRPVILAGTQQYDGSTTVQGTSLGVSNLVQGDTVTIGGSVVNGVSSANANAVAQNLLTLNGLTLSNGNYTLSGGSGSVTITPRVVSLSGGKFYDGTTTVAGNNLQVTNAVGGDLISVTGKITNGIADPNASSTAKSLLTLSGLSLSNANYTLDGGSGVVTVSPVLVSLSGSKVYDGTTLVQGSQMSVNSVLPGETVTVTGSGTLSSKDVGTWSFAAGAFALSSSNYRIISFGRVQIDPRPVILTGTKIYNGSTFAAGSVLSISNAVGNDVVTVGGNGGATLASANAGTQAINALSNLTLSNSNYTMDGASGSVTVAPRKITVTADALSRAYGDANPALTYVVGGDRLVNGEQLAGALATTADQRASKGTYDITQGSVTSGNNPNYAITFKANTLTIDPRQITVTANAQSRAYGDANPGFTYVVGGSGLVNGDQLAGALATTADQRSGKGTYDITQGTLAASSNYALTFKAGILTVDPRQITVTANAQSRAYGDANPDFTYVVAGNGLVNGDQLGGALATTADQRSSKGTYGITQGTITTANNPNYAITFKENTLVIDPRRITVTADHQSRFAGFANAPLSYTVGGAGPANGDTLSGALSTKADATSLPGTYSVDQGTLAASGNYAMTFVPGTIVVKANPSLGTLPSAVTPALFVSLPIGFTALPDLSPCEPHTIAARLRASGTAPLFGAGPGTCND